MHTLFIVLGMISVVSGASLAKQMFGVLGPEATAVTRLAAAAILMTIIWRPWRFTINRIQLKAIIGYGVCVGLMNFMYYLTISRLPIGPAIAIEFIGPLSVAIYGSRRLIDAFWIGLVILGLVLIFPLFSFQQSLDPLGIVCALIAGAIWALYIIQSKRIASNVPAGLAAPLGMFIGFLITLPFGIQSASLALTQPKQLISMFAVGFLSSVLPYSLQLLALRKISTQHFSLLTSLQPALAAIAGYIFLNENLSYLQLSAIFFIVAASVGSSLTAAKTQSVPADT